MRILLRAKNSLSSCGSHKSDELSLSLRISIMGNCIELSFLKEAEKVMNEDQRHRESISSDNNNCDSGRGSFEGPVSQNATDYCMTHPRRGICLIINNEKFDLSTRLPNRPGSDKDTNALTKCFSNLNFDVEILQNKSVREIQSRLQRLSQQDFTFDDCLVICILTHGEAGVLCGRDGRYTVDYLTSLFTADRCPSLSEKPKIFFIQACQGTKLDRGVKIDQHSDEVDAEAEYYKIPVMADFLIMYATYPGYSSWRSPVNGSWFIQAMVSVLNRNHIDTDLLSMLTMVNRKVAYEYMSFSLEKEDYNGNKQIPCVTSMLTRRVYFSSNTPLNHV